MFMPTGLRPHYAAEIANYRIAKRAADGATAWHHLERAHIIGQAYVVEHTHSHWLMLKTGWASRDGREIWGQIIRLLAGGLISLVGRIPTGNTGGANVPAERVMPIPPDLEALLKPYRK